MARCGVAAVLFALPLALLWRPLLLGESFFYEDIAAQYLPREALLARQGASGWDPHLFLGMPLTSDPTTAPYEPVRAIARALAWTPGRGLVAFFFVYLLAATLGTYVYARRLGASRLGAVAAMLTLVGGSSFVVRLHHPWMFASLALIPWTAWLADRLVARPRLTDGIAIGLVIAWGALGGHPQVPFMTWLFVAAYLVCGALIGSDGPFSLRAAMIRLVAVGWRAGVGLMLSLGLLARHYAPVVATLSLRQRAQHRSLEFAGQFALDGWSLVRAILPDALGSDMAGNYFGPPNYHEQLVYLGLPALWLGALGLLWRERRRAMLPILLVGGGALCLAVGRALPLFHAAYYLVPGFRWFRAPARYAFFACLAAAVLVGRVVTRIEEGSRPPGSLPIVRRLRWLWIPLMLACADLAGMLVAWPEGPLDSAASATVRWAAARAALFAGLGGFLIDRWLCGRLAGRRAALLLVASLAGDLGAQWLPYRQTGRAVEPDPAVVAALVEAAPARVYVYTRPWDTAIVPLLNWGEAAGYDDLRGYNQVVPRDVLELFAEGDALGRGPTGVYDLYPFEAAEWLLDLGGVRRLVARPDDWPTRWRALPVVARGGGYEVRERQGYLPRTWLVGGAEVMDRRQALARLPRLDLRRVATVENDVGLPARSSGQPGEATILARVADRWVVETTANRPALLVVSDRFEPGWQATVDGQPASVQRADFLLCGVRVESGRHRVVLSYRAPGATWGSTVTAASLFGTGLLLGAGYFARRRRFR